MINPTDVPKAIAKLQERIKVKQELVLFTDMEIGELVRTIDKMRGKNDLT